MEKKNPYKFTLGFDKTKPTHVCAAEILNSVRDKADLIAYQYRHEGVSDYITSPVNIPELIRRICYFVEE